jgi:hypothetical protein
MTFKAQRGLEDRVAGGASAGRFAQRGRGFYRGRAGGSGWRFAGSRGSYFNRVVPRQGAQAPEGPKVGEGGDKRAHNAQQVGVLVNSQQQGQEGGGVVMKEIGEGNDRVAAETGTWIKCSRCAKKGHVAANCTPKIYYVIYDKHNDHVNYKCPVLKMSMPVAHVVGYAVHGLRFYHIPCPPFPRAWKDTRTTVISVEGQQLLMEEVKKELERLFPGKWIWGLQAHEGNTFLTKFPSKVELQRAVAFEGADIKCVSVPAGAKIKFEMWHEKEIGFLLPKVWIRVFGLRKELCEFLELWAVSSMLGLTQIVDMETTRKNAFGRVTVAVLNPSLIPERIYVVIGDHYFELDFVVEEWGFDENGEEAVIEWNKGGGDQEGER